MVKNVGEGIGQRAVGDAASGAYQGAKEAGSNVAKGTGKSTENQPGVSIEQAETVYSKCDFMIVTHGILFESGKDVIKPESLPTLKMILCLLNDDPGLKFSIEGHTDNQGNMAINQPLSEKRAMAVKTWLSGQGIAEGRLKTKGFGDTRPIRYEQFARRASRQPTCGVR